MTEALAALLCDHGSGSRSQRIREEMKAEWTHFTISCSPSPEDQSLLQFRGSSPPSLRPAGGKTLTSCVDAARHRWRGRFTSRQVVLMS